VLAKPGISWRTRMTAGSSRSSSNAPARSPRRKATRCGRCGSAGARRGCAAEPGGPPRPPIARASGRGSRLPRRARPPRGAGGAPRSGRALAPGQSIGPEHLRALLADEATPGAGATRKPDALTHREREIALLVARGLTNRAIATRLVIAERTADTHVSNILGK